MPLQQVGIACKAQIVREIAQSRSKRARTFQPTHPPTGKHVLPVLPLLKSFFVCQFMSIPLKGATSWGKQKFLPGRKHGPCFMGTQLSLPYLAPPWHGHQSAGAKIARSPPRWNGKTEIPQHRSHLEAIHVLKSSGWSYRGHKFLGLRRFSRRYPSLFPLQKRKNVHWKISITQRLWSVTWCLTAGHSHPQLPPQPIRCSAHLFQNFHRHLLLHFFR